MQLRTGRRGVIILGMHRSGTSALTRVVNLLGARLPRDLVPPASDNPLGFWESARVIALNEAFMREVGASPDDPDPLPDATFRSDAANFFSKRICSFLEEEFEDASLFALKDPRIARLAPLWIAALREFGAEVNFILPFRPAAEVARSLRTREAIPDDHSTHLWLRYLLDAERASRNFPRAFVDYAALVADWRTEMQMISERLDLAWPKLRSGVAVDIDAFIHPVRASSAAGARSAGVLDAWVQEVYGIYRGAAGSDAIDSDRLDEIAAELVRAEALYGPKMARILRELEKERGDVLRLTAAAEGLEALQARRLQDLESSHLRDLESERSEVARLTDVAQGLEAQLAGLEAQLAEMRTAAESAAASAADQADRMVGVNEALHAAQAEIEQRREAEANVRTRMAEVEQALAHREAQVEQALAHREALQSDATARTEALERRAAEDAAALSAAIQGEQALGGRLLEVLGEIRRFEARAEAAHEEVRMLSDELARTRRSADEAVRAQAARVDLILGSRSWALTRPIRGLGRVTRKLLAGGAKP